MKKSLLEQIKDKYQPLELFFLSDIHEKTMTQAAIKQELLRLTKDGSVRRYSYGVYYLPDKQKTGVPDSMDAIEMRYIKNGSNNIGFYTGINFINSITGKRPTIEDKLEIISNKATSGKKTVYMFSKRFILRKPYMPIDNDNYSLNAFLSYVAMTDLSTLKANYSLLANYIRKEHLGANEVMEATKFFPAKTASKLLATDLYRSLWKH